MNLEELRSVQDTERGRSDLQPLRESFYEEAGEYIADLKRRRDEAAAEADDPFSSPAVRRLTDEIETAEEVVEAVYERRLGKLVERASLAASEMTVDEDGLTAEERALFRDLVDRMEASKANVMATLDPETTASAEATGEETGTDPEDGDGVAAADLMGADDGTTTADGGRAESEWPTRPDAASGGDAPVGDGGETPDTGTPDDDRVADALPPTPGASPERSDGETESATGPDGPDRVTVRLVQDVGEILGVDDRQYDLAAEDVVQLPARNAAPLVERGAAERLE